MKLAAVLVGTLAVLQAHAARGAAKDITQNPRISVDGQRYWVEEVARGLKFPSAIVWLPSGDALITERIADNHLPI